MTALPTGACLAQVILAGLWEGLTLVPMAPDTDPVQAGALADPSAAVAAPGAFGGHDVSWAWRGEGPGGPALAPRSLRPAGLATPPARSCVPRAETGLGPLSCMVTLGEPGIWRLGALGRPVGCTISDGPGGSLLISGRAP